MNFKERGITVGDLLLFIILLISIFVVVKLKDSKNVESSKVEHIFKEAAIEAEIDERIL
mgnify:CR=1 FL=1